MRIQFLGAAETTSGSCYLLRFDQKKVLVDCGLFQGPREFRERNYVDFPFDPEQIDAVVLTHAHIDHSGLLPKLVKHGFQGPIYATGVTTDLCSIMLADSGYIQESEVERKNRRLRRRGEKLLTPIYTVEDAEAAMDHFKRMVYDEEVEIFPTLRVRFRDAGHILGAAIAELWVTDGDETKKLVFSGDLGNVGQPIVQDPSYITEADLLIVESTYGTRLHEERDDRLELLAEIVNRTIDRGGNLLIPAFSLGRTQDLLYSFKVLQEKGAIPELNIYIDSPLATKATKVFQKHAHVFDYETRTMIKEGRSPFDAPNVRYTESVQESIRLNSISEGLVIIAGSGMATAGRIKHHLKHNLWREQATVLLVGYQAQGTLGRRLQDGAQEVRIHGDQIKVGASIETISGFSAHADQAALLSWLRRFRQLGRVFVTHGESESSHGLAELIRKEFEVPVMVPKLDEIFAVEGEATLSTWDDQYRDFSVEDDFAGIVQVTEGSEIQFRGAYGLAQRRYEIKNTSFTSFNLGSGREFFAQVALARLINQGKLTEADVGSFSHNGQWEEKLEQLTDEPAWEVVTREVFGPVQMGQSAYFYLDQVPALAATGYTETHSGQAVENIYAILGEGLSPQLFSTAPDLTRFWRTLSKGEFLPEDLLQKLLAPYRNPRQKEVYAIQGTAPGVRVTFGGNLEEPLTIAVLSNVDEGSTSLFEQLLAISSQGR